VFWPNERIASFARVFKPAKAAKEGPFLAASGKAGRLYRHHFGLWGPGQFRQPVVTSELSETLRLVLTAAMGVLGMLFAVSFSALFY